MPLSAATSWYRGLARNSGVLAVVMKSVVTIRGICATYRLVLTLTLGGPARSACPLLGCRCALLAPAAGEVAAAVPA